MILCPTKAERTTKGRMRITSRHKKPDFCAFSSALLCNKAATFSFLDKVFGAAHSPPRRGGVSATSKTMDPFRSVADGVVSSAHLRRPAALTTITASRYCARASRPSAPLLWIRGIFLMAQPLLRLRPIGLALRALLCEEGEYDAFKFRPNGNIIDIWLRPRRAKPFVANSPTARWRG